MPFVKVNGIKIFYKKQGSGPPILLIQGLGYEHRPFKWLADELSKDWTVIMFDNRGVGRSEVPQGPYTIEQMADDAAGLLQKIGIEKATIMGISLGGYIAQMFALRHPQMVERLVIGCSYFSGNPERLGISAEAMEAITRRDGTVEEIARRGLLVAFSKEFPVQHPDIFEKLVRWRVELPVTAAGYMAQLQAALGFNVESRIGSLTCPVLIIHGDKDIVVPVERGYELFEKIEGAKLKILEGCGHLFFIEKARETARAITSFAFRKKAGRDEMVSKISAGAPWHFWDLLAKRASLTPERVALMDEKGKVRISFEELNLKADKIARFLIHLGIKKGQRVGILSRNRLESVEVLYACAKCGAVFVPFNTRLSGAEFSAIAADSTISVLFLDENNIKLAESASDVLPSKSMWFLFDKIRTGKKTGIRYFREAMEFDSKQECGIENSPEVTENDPWIICYTGGTTGIPKGAVLGHGTVFWNAINTIVGWGIRDDEVAPIFTPLFHTGGLNVLLTPVLLMGGCCIIVEAFDPSKAFNIIRRAKATYVFMVPSMFRMMMENPKWEKERFRSVRNFVTGGAPCPREIFEAFASKGKNFRMGYGLTEAGPNNFHIDPDRALEFFGSVGKPLPFVEARVTAGGKDVSSIGEIGELEIRGPHVFSGYFGKPQETADVLSGGWLHTGDLAKKDAEGNFWIVGRKKEMFISGGENIYPAQVESAILQHPAVREVAVVAFPDEKWGEVGLAAISVRKGMQVTETELIEFLKGKLAKYEIPKKILFMDELPKTAAGKIDKKGILKRYSS